VSTVAAAGAEALIALPKWLPKDAFEFMLVELLRRGVLKEDFAHTAYATNSYLKVRFARACIAARSAGWRSQQAVARSGPVRIRK
jgi:hypothetical protein